MKKYGLLMACLVMILLLAGCGTKEKKTLCKKEYNGSYYDYEFVFKKDVLTALTTKDLTEITEESEVDNRFNFMKEQIPAMEKIYPGATIEAIKDGNKVGAKIIFNFEKNEFKNLNLGFNADDNQEKITASMTDSGYTCEAK